MFSRGNTLSSNVSTTAVAGNDEASSLASSHGKQKTQKFWSEHHQWIPSSWKGSKDNSSASSSKSNHPPCPECCRRRRQEETHKAQRSKRQSLIQQPSLFHSQLAQLEVALQWEQSIAIQYHDEWESSQLEMMHVEEHNEYLQARLIQLQHEMRKLKDDYQLLAFQQGQQAVMEGLLPPVNHQLVDTTEQLGHYVVLEELGWGATASVWKARDMNTQQLVALKKIPISNLTSWQCVEQLAREVQALQLDHTHKLVWLDTIHTTHSIGIITPLAMTSVHSLLHHHRHHSNSSLDLESVRQIMIGVLQGLDFLHSTCHVAHLDVKPENILLVETTLPIHSKHVRLCDFGSCSFGKHDIESRHKDMPPPWLLGTPGFFAPEMRRQEWNGPTADMWSVGVTFMELTVGMPHNWMNVYLREVDLESGLFWCLQGMDIADKCLANLLLEGLLVQPETRWTAAAALQHEWVSTIQREDGAVL